MQLERTAMTEEQTVFISWFVRGQVSRFERMEGKRCRRRGSVSGGSSKKTRLAEGSECGEALEQSGRALFFFIRFG